MIDRSLLEKSVYDSRYDSKNRIYEYIISKVINGKYVFYIIFMVL